MPYKGAPGDPLDVNHPSRQGDAAATPVPKTAAKQFFDKAAYVVGIVGPLGALPQLIKIFASQSAEDVSILSYSMMVATAVVWLGYGIVNRSWPLIISNTTWIFLEGGIIVGAILYGGSFG